MSTDYNYRIGGWVVSALEHKEKQEVHMPIVALATDRILVCVVSICKT